MIFIQKTWIRIVLSLFAGGLITEFFTINSSDPNHLTTPNRNSFYTLILGVIIFSILSFIVKRNNKNSIK